MKFLQYGEQMALEDVKYEGVVCEVGLERDHEEFRNFNLTVAITVKTDKKLNLREGEKLIKQLQRELLGKNIELGAVAIPCPTCGRSFNTENGMKQHMRRAHEGATEEPAKPKPKPKKKRSRKKK